MAPTPQNLVEERKRYAKAFSETMIKLWQEKIVLAGRTRAYDTGALFRSVAHNFSYTVSGDGVEMAFQWEMKPYGVYVERGVGRGYFHGNHGDIGPLRKPRHKRPWMSPKYWLSLYNIRDYMAEALGREAVAIVSSISKV